MLSNKPDYEVGDEVVAIYDEWSDEQYVQAGFDLTRMCAAYDPCPGTICVVRSIDLDVIYWTMVEGYKDEFPAHCFVKLRRAPESILKLLSVTPELEDA